MLSNYMCGRVGDNRRVQRRGLCQLCRAGNVHVPKRCPMHSTFRLPRSLLLLHSLASRSLDNHHYNDSWSDQGGSCGHAQSLLQKCVRQALGTIAGHVAWRQLRVFWELPLLLLLAASSEARRQQMLASNKIAANSSGNFNKPCLSQHGSVPMNDVMKKYRKNKGGCHC